MAIPLLVYFFFPHLYLLPFVWTGHSLLSPSPGVKSLFAPVNYLVDHCPPYAALMAIESDWTGIH